MWLHENVIVNESFFCYLSEYKKICNLPFIVIEVYSTSRSSTAENPGSFKKGYFAS